MQKLKREQRGITLIALVVTIIVLMILSGVVVAALIGNNGLITRSGEAKESQRAAPTRNVSNNIFDLAESVFEWTTEGGGSGLVLCGGDYYDSGSSFPLSYRGDADATGTGNNVGFRTALYL